MQPREIVKVDETETTAGCDGGGAIARMRFKLFKFIKKRIMSRQLYGQENFWQAFINRNIGQSPRFSLCSPR